MNPALALLGIGLIALPSLAGSPTLLIIAYAALFLPYLWLLRRPPTRALLWGAVLTAVGARVLLLPATPLLSDDIYRYVWDGRVAAAGINPFAFAPASEALAGLRDAAIWPLINHPEVPTIYPPGAQFVFRANAALDGGTSTLRGLLLLIEFGWMALAMRWMSRHDPERAARAFMIYALNPLVIVEIAWSGHLDVLAWAPLAIGLWVLSQRPQSLKTATLAGALLGVSIASKLLGVVLLPFLLLRRPSKGVPLGHALRRRLAIVVTATIVVMTSYVPYLDVGPQRLFAGFGTYAAKWSANASVYAALESTTRSVLRHNASDDMFAVPGDREQKVYIRLEKLNPAFTSMGWTKEWEGKQIPNTTLVDDQVAASLAKFVGACIMGLVLLWAILLLPGPVTGSLLLLTFLYIVAPTVHPWYVAWLVPLAALTGWRTPLAFSAAVIASYAAWASARSGGPWEMSTWLLVLEYGCVAGVAWWEIGLSRATEQGSGEALDLPGVDEGVDVSARQGEVDGPA